MRLICRMYMWDAPIDLNIFHKSGSSLFGLSISMKKDSLHERNASNSKI